MDEKSAPLNPPWDIEIIPDKNHVVRQVPVHQTYKDSKERRIPNESHFKPDSDGLSVNWHERITESDIYYIISISRKAATDPIQYKEYTAFKLFRFQVGSIRIISGINDVIHSPVFHGNPAPIGYPNNPAHASIVYEDDEEIRLKLCDLISNDFDRCFIPFDTTTLKAEVNKLRERLNNTKYHVL